MKRIDVNYQTLRELLPGAKFCIDSSIGKIQTTRVSVLRKTGGNQS